MGGLQEKISYFYFIKIMKRAVFVLWVLVTAHRIYTSPWIHRGGRAADGRVICKQLSLPSVGGETLIGERWSMCVCIRRTPLSQVPTDCCTGDGCPSAVNPVPCQPSGRCNGKGYVFGPTCTAGSEARAPAWLRGEAPRRATPRAAKPKTRHN